MFVIYMMGWWYGAGWKHQFTLVGKRVTKVSKAFSGGALLRTLFSPWKQIVTGTERDAALGDKMRAILDNIISRFVGFMVRSLTLLAAVITLIATLLIGLVLVLAWPLVPFAPIGLFVIWMIQ